MNCMVTAFLALLLAFSVLPGCKRPEPSLPPAPVEQPPEPGQEYSNPDRQREYEQAWRRYLAQFEAPEMGDYLWVHLTDGSYVGGEVRLWASSEIVLRDGTNDVNIARSSIDKDSLHRVYADAFARRQALGEIEAELTPRVDKHAATPLVGSKRYSLADSVTPRKGPGDRFQRADVPELTRGTLLEVIDQQGPWIKVSAQGIQESFWMNGLATRPIPNAPKEDNSPVIKQLLNHDLLTDYDPQLSTAHLPRGIWVGTHPAVREGLSRVLAEHSAAMRSSPTAWIEIKDTATGRRLARYSTSQGFRQ
ncbi:MAG: hypothetical protein H3C50_01705 [Kiritimatiellae bacterium]|nr:hypothetical protein [Kiritimatiellia bacterium]